MSGMADIRKAIAEIYGQPRGMPEVVTVEVDENDIVWMLDKQGAPIAYMHRAVYEQLARTLT